MARTLSVTDIENQIAKVTAELEKARTAQYSTAEKAFLAAQKRTAAAQAKVRDLLAKGGTTPVAKNRLTLAKDALTEQQNLLAAAKAQFDSAKAMQNAAKEIAKNISLLTPGKKSVSKADNKSDKKAQQNQLIKEDKQTIKKRPSKDINAAKSSIKTDTKEAKKANKDVSNAKSKKIKSLNLNSEQLSTEPTTTETVSPNTANTKPAAKKAIAKKETKPMNEKSSAASNESPTDAGEKNLPDPITVDNAPTPSDNSEPPASEAGKDAKVETETVPPAESAPEEKSEKPVND